MPVGSSRLSYITCLIGLSLFLPLSQGWAGELPSSPSTIVRHALRASIDPDQHQLTVIDRMVVRVGGSQPTLDFTLAKSLRLETVALVTRVGTEERLTPVPTSLGDAAIDSHLRSLLVSLPDQRHEEVTLEWRYRGAIDDLPREPRHLRFVTPSETSGHIGPEGVYMSSETGWYPDLTGSLASYALTVEMPSGWTTVSQGHGGTEQDCSQPRSDGSCVSLQTWTSGVTEALTLVANRFMVKTRDWKSATGQAVQLATYLFPDDAALADEYLDATVKYLDAYVPLLGPFPFEQFAVVENFFASGLGMPSFTLLGSGSIKRHYTQPYALGHEIVHSWIGNAVWNRPESGNWVEGLTTYLTNYYWHELIHDDRQAREQRRLMLQGYSLYVTPQQDYPIAEFQRKSDEKDNAIGYQKAAMVFHQLRMEIGDEAFWRAVKQLIAEYSGRHADWRDLERIFTQSSGRELRWFFEQWIERPGAPAVAIVEAAASPSQQQPGAYTLRVRLTREGGAFRFILPLAIAMNGSTTSVPVALAAEQRDIELVVPAEPLNVSIDPEFMSLQRLKREQMAPVLNLFVTDQRKAVLPLFPDSATPFKELVARIKAQDAQDPTKRTTAILPMDIVALPPSGSVLVVATADRHAQVQSLLAKACGDLATVGPDGFRIAGTAYEGRRMAVLLSCHRPEAPGSVVTLLYAMDPAAAAKVARLLFFYGWQSAVVFDEGTVTQRDMWQAFQGMKEVRRDEQR
ncbi:M1 family metallopeptidase [Nitrospira lenta]|uniref:Putative Peptidase M n=1 Tax=Nitrospira lenta TaxID=1436998 RepID=A0A330LD38_9BACT|nr:M1 family aminopeptidase [Nitrospira lenta]SPP64899.1 putative Peptidase M [Nitrospira lenta]